MEDAMQRAPMTPAEFDAAMRRLRNQYTELRTTSRNRYGDPGKHGIDMAEDLTWKDPELGLPLPEIHPDVADVVDFARGILGLWGLYHNAGTGLHFHFQGLAPGPVPEWWAEKYLML